MVSNVWHRLHGYHGLPAFPQVRSLTITIIQQTPNGVQIDVRDSEGQLDGQKGPPSFFFLGPSILFLGIGPGTSGNAASVCCTHVHRGLLFLWLSVCLVDVRRPFIISISLRVLISVSLSRNDRVTAR